MDALYHHGLKSTPQTQKHTPDNCTPKPQPGGSETALSLSSSLTCPLWLNLSGVLNSIPTPSIPCARDTGVILSTRGLVMEK